MNHQTHNPGLSAQSLRERMAALQGRLAQTSAASPLRPAVVELPGGREVDTPHGPCYVLETVWPLDYQHGYHQFEALQQIAPDLLAMLSGQPRTIDTHQQIVFLDTETTGLAGGTGTHLFLIGIGFLRSTGDETTELVVQQYFLRDLREERALLAALSDTLSRFTTIVTFNGKSFDWPLLHTRFVLQRTALPAQVQRWPHLDLVHPARRIWKHRLASCSLSALEAAVLGVGRHNDIPGALIPERYFQYLRDHNIRPLLPILEHNRTDILSLVTLLIQIGNYLSPAPLCGTVMPGSEYYGLATLQAALGAEEASQQSFQAALADQQLSPVLRRAARMALASSYKRQRQWSAAIPLWRSSLQSESRRKYPDPWAHIELAKYYEHVARDYLAAIAVIEAANQLLALRKITSWQTDLNYRLNRLQRKATQRLDQDNTAPAQRRRNRSASRTFSMLGDRK